MMQNNCTDLIKQIKILSYGEFYQNNRIYYKQNMGNICNNGHIDKQQTTETIDTFNKNFPICQFTVNKHTKINIVLGTLRYHRSETLLLITQPDYLQYCPQLREYAQNFSSLIEHVTAEKKKLILAKTNKNCPYKKLQVCILSPYNSNQLDAYIQQFESIIREVLAHSSDITFQLAYTTQNTNGIPNQTLISVLLRFISANISKPLKITIISSEAKLLNMVRYQVTKLDHYAINMINTEIQM